MGDSQPALGSCGNAQQDVTRVLAMSTSGAPASRLVVVAEAGEWRTAGPTAGMSGGYANHAGLDQDGVVGTMNLTATLTRACWPRWCARRSPVSC